MLICITIAIVCSPSKSSLELKNGEEKGQLIHLTNEYSSSGAYDHEYHVGNELFVSIDTNKGKMQI